MYSRMAGASWGRQVALMEAEVASTEVSMEAPMPSRIWSSSSPDLPRMPPERISSIAMAARPTRSGGSYAVPV